MRGAGVSLMEKLGELEDPRQPSNGIRHDFREILVILIAAVLSDCDTVEDITFWARTKEAWLQARGQVFHLLTAAPRPARTAKRRRRR